ncbi:MAG: hypothetical protein ABI707_17865 [Ferruginibacter sp.]
MKSKISFGLRLFCIGCIGILLLQGCKKQDTLVLPPSAAHFTNLSAGTYFITAPGITYKIPVGVTTVSNVDRVVSFTVTSPTGAVAGTHYSLSGNTVTIPAGKAIDSIEVKGVFDQYTSGRKDSLLFVLMEPSIKGAPYNDTFRLYMRGPCFEGDVTLTDLLGDYKKTNETFGTSPYGPYKTSITSAVQTSPTTGDIVVSNIFDAGWNPITFSLDWTDPLNRTVTLVRQTGIADGGTVNPAYTGEDVLVQPFTGQKGTFSACKGTLQLKMQIGITGLGVFPSLYTVSLAR